MTNKEPRRPLPALILMTDAERLADPEAAVRALPRGSAVILRHYGSPGRAALAARLALICRRRGLTLLVAADPGSGIGAGERLAAAVGAGGVHWPEALARLRPALARRRRPGWIVTVAAHGPAAVARGGRAGADAVLLGPVFETASHPGGRTIGPLRFALWCRRSRVAVYALGGVTAATAKRLIASGAAGIAGIGALAGDAAACLSRNDGSDPNPSVIAGSVRGI